MESIGHLQTALKHLWKVLPVVDDDEDVQKWLDLTSEGIKLAEDLVESSDLDHHRRKACQTCLNHLLTIKCQLETREVQQRVPVCSPGLEDELLEIERQLREARQEAEPICTPAPEEDILKIDRQLQAISQDPLSGEIREIERQLEHRGGELIQESVVTELPTVKTSKEVTPQVT